MLPESRPKDLNPILARRSWLLLAYGLSVLLLSVTLFLGLDQAWISYQTYGWSYEVTTIIQGSSTTRLVNVWETLAASAFIAWLDVLALIGLRLVWSREDRS